MKRVAVQGKNAGKAEKKSVASAVLCIHAEVGGRLEVDSGKTSSTTDSIIKSYHFIVKHLSSTILFLSVIDNSISKEIFDMKRAKYQELFQQYPDVVTIPELCTKLGGIAENTARKLLRGGQIKSNTTISGRPISFPRKTSSTIFSAPITGATA